jgi:hypothetical protein
MSRAMNFEAVKKEKWKKNKMSRAMNFEAVKKEKWKKKKHNGNKNDKISYQINDLPF